MNRKAILTFILAAVAIGSAWAQASTTMRPMLPAKKAVPVEKNVEKKEQAEERSRGKAFSGKAEQARKAQAPGTTKPAKIKKEKKEKKLNKGKAYGHRRHGANEMEARRMPAGEKTIQADPQEKKLRRVSDTQTQPVKVTKQNKMKRPATTQPATDKDSKMKKAGTTQPETTEKDAKMKKAGNQ